MNRFPITVGSIVISMAGRDAGRPFVVMCELDENFVRVADGRLRSVEKQKTKRRKHVKPTGQVVEELSDRIRNGKPVENFEVRAWLSKEEG